MKQLPLALLIILLLGSAGCPESESNDADDNSSEQDSCYDYCDTMGQQPDCYSGTEEECLSGCEYSRTKAAEFGCEAESVNGHSKPQKTDPDSCS